MRPFYSIQGIATGAEVVFVVIATSEHLSVCTLPLCIAKDEYCDWCLCVCMCTPLFVGSLVGTM